MNFIISNKSSDFAEGMARDKLKQSEQHYRFLFENNPFPACIYDIETFKFLEVNDAALEYFGYTREDAFNLTLPDIILPEDLLKLKNEIDKAAASEKAYESIWRIKRKNGEILYIESRSNQINYKGRNARLVLGQDITKRVATEIELKISNERYRLATKASFDAIWDANLLTDKMFLGEGFETLFGYKFEKDNVPASTWTEHIHADDKERVIEQHNAILENSEKNFWSDQYRYLRADGSVAHVIDRCVIIRDENGKALRMVGAMQDNTERKKLEQELLNQQKAISQATINTQERERAEISKELHDNVNQVLTTTKLYLDLAIANPELKDELIKKSSKNIISAIDEIRQLSQSLMIPSLGDLGLVDSVEDLIENINAAKKITAVFLCEEIDENTLNENQKLALFRIVQEALNNIVKHAEATETIIELSIQNNIINLIIKDDGKGFDPSAIKNGAGLNNIRNRVYLLNGTLTLDTQPGKGCALVVELPHLI